MEVIVGADYFESTAHRIAYRAARIFSPGRAFAWNLKRFTDEGRVSWGRHTYGSPEIYTFADDATRLSVGSFTSIAKGVSVILGGNHPTDRGTTYPFRLMWGMGGVPDGFPSSGGDVTIGNDVWVGFGCTIVSGVTIGDGVIVAAGSVVAKDLPPYSICGGVPARPIKYRMPPAEVAALMELAWWDLEDAQIRKLVPLLSGTDIPRLIDAIREIRESIS